MSGLGARFVFPIWFSCQATDVGESHSRDSVAMIFCRGIYWESRQGS